MPTRQNLQPIAFVFDHLFSLLSVFCVAVIFLNLSILSLCHAQGSDVTPPQLTSFTFFPSSIDVTGGSQVVTVTVDATDDLSGVSSGGVIVEFKSPSGIQWSTVWLFNLIAGDAMDGTHENTIIFEPFIESGIWTTSYVLIYDAVNNTILLDTAALAAAGFPTELAVTSISDTVAPTLTDITLSQTNIDVSTGAQVVSVNLQLADSLSGVTFTSSTTPSVGGVAVTFISPSGMQSVYMSISEFALSSGNINNGIWSSSNPPFPQYAIATFPQYSEPGLWEISRIQIFDVAGNSSDLSNVQLETLGLNRTVNVTSIPSDTAPPNLTGIEIVPSLIDTASSSQDVVVTLSIEDDLSGISFLEDTPDVSQFYGVRFKSPSGAQELGVGVFSTLLSLVSGTVLNGQWQGTMEIPQFSEAGTWRVDWVNLRDSVHNVNGFSTSDLELLGLQTKLIVIRPSLVVDGVIDPVVGGTVKDQTFGDSAQVTIPPNVLTQSTEVAIDVFEERLDIPNPVGFISNGTRFVNINLDPEPAFPLPAPGLTAVLPLENPLLPGTPLSLFRVDPATSNLVPALDVLGQPVVGTVDASGLNATFTGIATLSTVVGLLEPPTPNIEANGFDGPVNLGTNDTLSINVSLAAQSGLGEDCDWWVVADTPYGWFYLVASTMSWGFAGTSYTDLLVSHQGALFNLSTTEVLDIPVAGLLAGKYTLYFAVDMNMNGILDFGELFSDSVVVNITE